MELESSKRDFLHLILKFLEDEDIKDTQHRLEQETGIFFNEEHFRTIIVAGQWDQAVNYLNGFTKIGDNELSTKIFFEIFKHKYMEALYRQDRTEAFHILMKDQKVFSTCDPELFKEILMLLTLEDCREHTYLAGYGDNESARKNLLGALLAMIKDNPLMCDKLVFPIERISRLQTMINHCLQNKQLDTAELMCHGTDHTLPVLPSYMPPTFANHTVIQCKVLPLQRKDDPASKVARLLYTNAGDIVVLATNGDQELWKLRRQGKQKLGVKANATVDLQLWHPKNGLSMVNDVSGTPEESVPCLAFCNGNIMSAVGGKVSVFNLKNLQLMKIFLPPPPAPTFLAGDNNIVAVGMEDSSIQIYNLKMQKVRNTLKGHQKHITGLAFSNKLHILVSSCADGQICVWNTDTWEKIQSLTLQHSVIQVQFHSNQIHMLVCQEKWLAIYEASNNVECIHQWEPKDDLLAGISVAAYSCKSLLVYVAFNDGSIGVFDAETLRVACRILPSAYIPTSQPFAYPIVLATHPEEPSKLVVGLTDGSVKVLEPSGSDGWLGISSADPANNGIGIENYRTPAAAGAASSSATVATTSNNLNTELQSRR